MNRPTCDQCRLFNGACTLGIPEFRTPTGVNMKYARECSSFHQRPDGDSSGDHYVAGLYAGGIKERQIALDLGVSRYVIRRARLRSAS